MENKTFTDKNTDIKYWKERWELNEIGFHKITLHQLLVKHLDILIQNRQNLKILIPLSGKALDIPWLASLGHTVVGVEAVKEACEQLFAENNLKYTATQIDSDFVLYSSEDGRIRIYCGDFFKFDKKYEEPFDCVWDRGSLVALPAKLREKYAPHILRLLTNDFRYLLDTFNYNPDDYPGPPHFVSIDEIKRHYAQFCKIEKVDEVDHRPFGPNQAPATELVHLLTKL